MLIAHLDMFPATPEGAKIMKGSPLLGWIERMRARPSVQATDMQKLMAAAARDADTVARRSVAGTIASSGARSLAELPASSMTTSSDPATAGSDPIAVASGACRS